MTDYTTTADRVTAFAEVQAIVRITKTDSTVIHGRALSFDGSMLTVRDRGPFDNYQAAFLDSARGYGDSLPGDPPEALGIADASGAAHPSAATAYGMRTWADYEAAVPTSPTTIAVGDIASISLATPNPLPGGKW